jgi:hypothetical protein
LAGPVKTLYNAVDDVFDVGVIPTRRPVAIHRNGLPGKQLAGELAAQDDFLASLRALAGAVDERRGAVDERINVDRPRIGFIRSSISRLDPRTESTAIERVLLER